jgi:Glycine rich protein/SprB repeat/Secretion system C-terminal sorting domain
MNFKTTHMKKNSTQLRSFLLATGLCALTAATAQVTTTFNYTGTVQTYTVPAGVTTITVDVYGAQGGFGYNVPSVTPGLGGRVQATVAVTPLEVLNIYVGGQGGPGGTTIGGTAGYNGGGTGGGWPGGRSGGGGGGASDIRQGGTALSNRIVIGAGGGGTGVNYSSGNAGGNGGGLTGSNGLTGTYLGGGATQSAGGAPNGTLGAGGNAPNNQTGGGGGGGYYGGGSSAWEGGGGGSSYTAPAVTSVTHTAGARTGNGLITITAMVPFTATVSQGAFIACNGQSTASLTAAPSGGSSPYSYSWAPSGGTAATASGLAAGTYTVTVTDNIGSTTTQTFTVTQPSVLSTVTTGTAVSCFGGSNGAASTSPSGGTSPYTYAWSTGGTASSISGLIAGVYSCTVTCSNGCTTTTSTTISEPALLAATISGTAVTCSGDVNGVASVSATGGTAPYTYMWSNGGTTATITGLAAGAYSCTVTCANGCTTTQSVTITSPSALSATSTSSSILCYGNAATITLSAAGGTAPYTGDSTFLQVAGTYTYTITDGNGCTATTSITVTEPAPILVNATAVNATCNGSSDGSIDLTVTGGTSPYTFNWNNGQFTTEDLTNIPAGSYSGILTDANGCQDSGTVVITEPAAIVATLSIATSTVCVTDAPLALSGATPAGGVFSGNGVNAGMFTPATAGVGSHMITYTYTDSSGCTGTATDSITVDICTGLSNNSTEAFNVYPNPNNGTFTINVSTVSDVTIFDAQGKLVYSAKMLPENQNIISLENDGMYMINVTSTNGQRSVQRVMVTK